MTQWLKLGQILMLLALALMMGGMLVLGALVAPTVFAQLTRPEAASLMTFIFRRFDTVLLVLLGLLLMGAVCRSVASRFQRSQWTWLRVLLVVSISAMTLLSVLKLDPQIQAQQQAGIRRNVGAAGHAFDSLHKQAEGMYKANLACCLVLFILLV